MYSLRNADRFDNYREITARFDSIGKCGHAIKRGDLIGYNRRHGARCSACWANWKAENLEAAQYEAACGYEPNRGTFGDY